MDLARGESLRMRLIGGANCDKMFLSRWEAAAEETLRLMMKNEKVEEIVCLHKKITWIAY